jgi:hypothetical protein
MKSRWFFATGGIILQWTGKVKPTGVRGTLWGNRVIGCWNRYYAIVTTYVKYRAKLDVVCYKYII